MSEEQNKRPKDNDFFQQRFKYWQPLFTPRNVILTFLGIGIIFILIGIPILITSNNIVEYKIVYDGSLQQNGNCELNTTMESRECDIVFKVEKEMKPPVYVYYELHGFFQNHRLYVGSRNDKQLMGQNVSLSDLTNSCDTATLYNGSIPYNPCGLIANSFFNDTFTLMDPNLKMNESGIAWKYDLPRYQNPSFYGSPSYRWLYQTYEGIIHKNKSDDSSSAEYNGGGVMNEHFIVWMRTAALPNFRKLYGHIDSTIPANSEVKFHINARFFINDNAAEKSLILTTTNWLGGKNLFLAYGYIVVGAICLIFALVFIIKQCTCPRKLGDIKYLKIE